MKQGLKIMFGLPCATGWYNTYVMTSIVNQLAYVLRGHHGITNALVHNTLIHSARNQIAVSAVEKEFDYLFFIDSDCVIPEDTLERLVEHDKDIVAGMYFGKVIPFPPIIYEKTDKDMYRHIMDYPENQLIEVDAVGMGCCLIKTEVLKHFVCDREMQYEDGHKEIKKVSYAFEPMPAPDSDQFAMGEDVAFCKRVQDAGYKIYVDTGLQCAHQTVTYIDEEYYKRTRERMKAVK